MSRQYLRITKDWTKITDVDMDPLYIANVSGISVQIKFEDLPIPPKSDFESYTVGGLITNLLTNTDKYTYARAYPSNDETSSNEAVIIIDTEEAIGSSEAKILQKQLESAMVEIMKLSMRVTDNELKHISMYTKYYYLLRKFLNSQRLTHEYLVSFQIELLKAQRRMLAFHLRQIQLERNMDKLSTELKHENSKLIERMNEIDMHIKELTTRADKNDTEHSEIKTSIDELLQAFYRNTQSDHTTMAMYGKSILSLRLHMLMAEMWISSHKNEFNAFKNEIENMTFSGLNNKIEALAIELQQVVTTATSINNKLNEYIPRIEEAWGDYSELVANEIDPMRIKLDNLHSSFVSLNNGIVQLSIKYTPEEIQEVFNSIVKNIPNDVQSVFTSLKNLMITISLNTINVDASVKKDDMILLNSDDEIMSAIATTK